MKNVINTGRRRLGITGRPALILDPNVPTEISDERAEQMRENRTVARWIELGVIEIVDANEPERPKEKIVSPKRVPKKITPRDSDKRDAEPIPDDLIGEGVEVHHLGGGWYQVYVNGFKVTDRNVRKDEAIDIAAEYE